MSLHAIADHMASKGRGPDSMLVHMSPRELQGLQALAMKHGGSLTINPDTGLPEAGFLDKLLPAVLGFALAPLTAGTSLAFLGATPFASAMTVGALQTLRTGDLGKGLMAGFSAYGGAGLQAGLAGAGASTLAGEGIATEAAKNAALEGVTLPADYAELAAKTATPDQIAAAKASYSPMELLSSGAKSTAASPEALGSFAKDNFKNIAYAAAPILADQAVKANLPTTTTKPGMIRPYAFDPYGGSYTAGTPYEAAPTRAAEGGLMGMNDGGYSPGQLDFAQHSEPVLRMAAGGSSYSTVREDGSVFDDLDQQNRDASREVIQEVPPRPIAPDLVNPLIVPATPAPVAGDTMFSNMTNGTGGIQAFVPVIDKALAAQQNATTGGLGTLAANQNAGATGAATGAITGGLDTLAANQNAAAITGATTGTTGGLDALAANQNAAADAAAKAKLGIFQTVYDPKTGREFVSPAQAAQYGVTDYVTEMPMKLELLNDTSKKAVTDAMAMGLTFDQALNKLGQQFNMSGKDFYNYEVQGRLRSADQQVTRDALASENKGLTPEQLTAKLQAYKDKPPTTAQEFADQRALYADYQNRYANSSWNYANMGGKAQDYSLKPSDYLGLKFTGYAEPINFALSNMNQMSPDYKEMSKILTDNPEINDVIDQLYKLNPNAMMFNSINPKYSGGTPDSAMASNFNNTVIKNLAGDIKRYGRDMAMQKFAGQQQNLLSLLPDAQGNLGNRNLSTMSNLEYRTLNDIKDSYTPIVDDAAWNKQAVLGAPKGASFSEPYRDPTTGKGLSLVYENGKAVGVRFINQSGIGNTVYNDSAKLVEAAYESGIPLSAFNEIAKKIGSDVLIPSDGSSYWPKGLKDGVKFSDLASGKLANVIASDDWLKFMVADRQAKDSNPNNPEYAGGLNSQIDSLRNQQKIAKDYLADISAGKIGTVATYRPAKTDTGTKVDTDTKVTRVDKPTSITTAPDTTLAPGIGGNTGPSIIGGGTTVNPNGTITTSPRIPDIPVGGFTGMTSLRDAYTQGGGSLGYTPYTPKTMEEFDAKYNKLTGGSKQEYDYLMGKTPYSPVPYTPTGEIMKPYWESVGKAPVNLSTKKYIFKDGKYELNPAYVKPPYVLAGEKAAALTNQDKEPTDNPGAGNKWVWNSTDKKWEAKPISDTSTSGTTYDGGGGGDGGAFANGGLMAMARGGMAQQFDLGGYSDGGRLLRGPGDGVSDSIPATIGNKRPARLADGEFVVPARIVSELGNGSTEAGARKLYAMMDRIQAARRGTVGKGRVAKNSRSEKYLPA